MKYRPLHKYGKKDIKIVVVVGIIIGLIIPYLSFGFYLIWHIPYEATMNYEIDPSEFIDADYGKMSRFADLYNYYFERDHIPLNYTLTVYWNGTDYDEIVHYGTAGDAAIWSGMNLAAQSLHYAAARKAENDTDTQNALRLVKKTLDGVSKLIAIPSGGIGKEYPAILARSVAPKNWTEVNNSTIDHYPPIEYNPDNMFPGAGKYKDWWWIGYPSTDQWSGIILGLGQCARIFRNEQGATAEWIKKRVRNLAIQIIEGFIKSNWMLLDMNRDGESRTTGQDFKISAEMTGVWVLSILKMGMMAAPDRYTSLYYHYALERNYINYMETDYRIFNLMHYYSLNINYNMLVNLVSLEQDPALRKRYENIVKKIYYPIIRISRNAWFNMGYLYMMHKFGIDSYSEDQKIIVQDISDQLMRFNVTRQPNGTTRLPERGGDRNPIQYEIYDPTEKYRENDFISLLYGWVLNMYHKNISRYAKRVDEYQNSDFLWQRPTWGIDKSTSYLRQDSGLAYLLPYYIGRYLEIIPETD